MEKLGQQITIRADYPDCFDGCFNSSLETGMSTGVVSPKLIVHPRQIKEEPGNFHITGNEIYAWLIETGKLSICIELADLMWWAEYPSRIPRDFMGNYIFGWKSVAALKYGYRYERKYGESTLHDDNKFLQVPFLNCREHKPCVEWTELKFHFKSDIWRTCLNSS